MRRLLQFVNACRRWRRDQQGSSTVETALGTVVMITMVTGVMEFCMMAYTYGVYADATRQGVRYAAEHGSDSSSCSGPSTGCADTGGANVVSVVTTYAGNYVTAATSVNVNVSYPDKASTPTSRVTVTTTFTYKPLLVQALTPSFTVTSAGRILF